MRLSYWKKRLTLLGCVVSVPLAILFLASGCVGVPVSPDNVFNTKLSLNEIWRIVYNTPLTLKGTPKYPEALEKYFAYYHLDFPGVDHFYGSFRSSDYLIAAHIFIPRFAVDTVYLVHGYLMHSGSLNRLIQVLLDHNFAVAVFDLPGHGFSSGDIADINSFSEYAAVLQNFIDLTKDTFVPPPLAVIGHSTGGAAVIEYLISHETVFRYHILTSPLIRSKMWGLSTAGAIILGGGIKSVPSVVADSTSDEAYRDFLLHREPLRRTQVPMNWVNALIRWNKKLKHIEPMPGRELLVLQGKADKVVDWKYNMNFIATVFPAARIVYFDKAKHDLHQETREIREKVWGEILDLLESRQY
jgi:alpha-beta hydrolase superfamily lysophospholipase